MSGSSSSGSGLSGPAGHFSPGSMSGNLYRAWLALQATQEG
jgi:hypothetical protein